MMKLRTALLAAGALLFCATLAAAQVVNPRVTTDSSIDTFSAQTVVRQITKPGMTDEQKCVACWKFMLDHFYHWTPPREPDTPGDVRDFAKAINTYGYGPCFVNAPVLTALWEALGYETRNWTITGHAIPEVKYGGKWHMIDGDARGYHKKADGAIASVRELAKDAKLLTDPPGGKSKPFYPFGAPDVKVKPFVFWGPASKMMDLYLSRKNNYQYNRRAVMGHPMYLTLRQGEALTLNRENAGKFVKPGKIKPEGVKFYKGGPREVAGKYTYGNGLLTWYPGLKAMKATDLLWIGSNNVTLKNGAVIPVKAGEPAAAVFRIWCPYALVTAAAKVTTAGGADAKCAISFDGGIAWTDIPVGWTGRKGINWATIDLTKLVAGRYEYLLKVSFAKGGISELYFNNTFQLSQLALPKLKVGKNKVTVLRGPDEGHVQLVRAKGKPRKARYIVKSEGLEAKGVRPAKRDCSKAYAVYKLAAPAPLTAISAGANMTMDPGNAKQYIEALYSLDGGKTWTSLWKRPNHRNWGNSQFEMDKRVALKNEKGVKEALFKYEMARGSKYFGVNSIRLYAFYKQVQPAGAKLALGFAWEEKNGGKWTAKKKSVVVSKFPHEFEVTCGGDAARVKSIAMEPAP